jgi:DNA helicase HerA-like ATPase
LVDNNSDLEDTRTLNSKHLGKIIAGNITNLVARLNEDLSVEEAIVGEFVTIQGTKYQFFGITTNLELASVNKELDILPPDDSEELLTSVLRGLSNYCKLDINVFLTRDIITNTLQSAKTIPVHYSEVRTASIDDIATVFGIPDSEHMEIGSPVSNPSIPLCLNMNRYIERSNGIFGKTGTGKTFLVRLLLANLINHNKVVNLIFDMHNEYGWEARNEETNIHVKGLKQLFPNEVLIFTLDKESSLRRKVKFDYEVQIPFNQLVPEDIMLLKRELNLNPTASEILEAIRDKKENWLQWFLELKREDVLDKAEELGLHTGAFRATHSKLQKLKKLSFLSSNPPDNTLKRIMENIEAGKQIIIEFGKYSSSLVNILVSNLLTRRIHTQYIKRIEEYLATKQNEPRKLLITIEEAHKFLTPALSAQTVFGTIARELRKYNVVLQIVDQRPSGIDPEILSQLGTRLTGALNDERDINAALVGVAKGSSLRNILANLEPKRNVLIFGYGTPIPVAVKVKSYDSDFYKEIRNNQLGLDVKMDPEVELFG